MHAENSITMRAPVEAVFAAAADLSRWPDFLPHYRWVRYLRRSPEKNVVMMAARRGWIPIRWTSEQIVDPHRREVRFRHLKAFTRGMEVVWTFEEQPDGVFVRIQHELTPTIPIVGRFIAERIIGRFFIHSVANQTLTYMKRHVEEKRGA
jgi:ribosome-associated toxin RatA of RatAB toxin-antitoxin module